MSNYLIYSVSTPVFMQMFRLISQMSIITFSIYLFTQILLYPPWLLHYQLTIQSSIIQWKISNEVYIKQLSKMNNDTCNISYNNLILFKLYSIWRPLRKSGLTPKIVVNLLILGVLHIALFLIKYLRLWRDTQL